MTGEALGVKPREFMNMQSTPLHQKIINQREMLEEAITFFEEEINELEVMIIF